MLLECSRIGLALIVMFDCSGPNRQRFTPWRTSFQVRVRTDAQLQCLLFQSRFGKWLCVEEAAVFGWHCAWELWGKIMDHLDLKPPQFSTVKQPPCPLDPEESQGGRNPNTVDEDGLIYVCSFPELRERANCPCSIPGMEFPPTVHGSFLCYMNRKMFISICLALNGKQDD